MNANDIELALRSRAVFNDSVDRIDAGTRQRLREARLHAQRGEARTAGARWMWPAGAALTAALALAVFLPRPTQAPRPVVSPPSVAVSPRHAAPASRAPDQTAVAQAAASDFSEPPSLETTDPDMLSDLDFYGWLAKQPDTANTGG
jgi:hypothetical protein